MVPDFLTDQPLENFAVCNAAWRDAVYAAGTLRKRRRHFPGVANDATLQGCAV